LQRAQTDFRCSAGCARFLIVGLEQVRDVGSGLADAGLQRVDHDTEVSAHRGPFLGTGPLGPIELVPRATLILAQLEEPLSPLGSLLRTRELALVFEPGLESRNLRLQLAELLLPLRDELSALRIELTLSNLGIAAIVSARAGLL
jgi:hypothetical protein